MALGMSSITSMDNVQRVASMAVHGNVDFASVCRCVMRGGGPAHCRLNSRSSIRIHAIRVRLIIRLCSTLVRCRPRSRCSLSLLLELPLELLLVLLLAPLVLLVLVALLLALLLVLLLELSLALLLALLFARSRLARSVRRVSAIVLAVWTHVGTWMTSEASTNSTRAIHGHGTDMDMG